MFLIVTTQLSELTVKIILLISKTKKTKIIILLNYLGCLYNNHSNRYMPDQ